MLEGGGGNALVYVNRSRLNAFAGWLGGIKRNIVGSRVRSALSKKLLRMRTTMERDFRAGTD